MERGGEIKECTGGCVLKKEGKRHKPKPEEPVKEMAMDAGSSKAGSGKRRRKKKTKLLTWRLSQELLEYLRTRELMGYIATLRPSILSEELFDEKLKEEIAAQANENREFDAYVLYQYRTKGYAEIQQEVTDDEEV